VICKQGAETVFLGRVPEDKDVDMICRLFDLGATMLAKRVRDTLAKTSF
jgi:hypothetical protein